MQVGWSFGVNRFRAKASYRRNHPQPSTSLYLRHPHQLRKIFLSRKRPHPRLGTRQVRHRVHDALLIQVWYRGCPCASYFNRDHYVSCKLPKTVGAYRIRPPCVRRCMSIDGNVRCLGSCLLPWFMFAAVRAYAIRPYTCSVISWV